jgi:hypothetical protein
MDFQLTAQQDEYRAVARAHLAPGYEQRERQGVRVFWSGRSGWRWDATA